MKKKFRALICSIVFLMGSHLVAQSPAVMKLLSPTEKEWLQSHLVLSLGVDPAWPPVEMLDEKGEYKGMAADLVHLIGRRLGVTIQPASGLTWTQAIYKIRNKELDLLSAVSRTSERDAFLNYTAVVIELPAVIITRHDKQENKNLNDYRGRQISVVQDYLVVDWIAANYPDVVVRTYATIDQALFALVNGDVEAYVGDVATASYAITHLGITSLTVTAYTAYSTGLSIGVRKDWPEVIAILNKAIATITSEERTAIRDRWIITPEKGIGTGEILLILAIVGVIGAAVFLFLLQQHSRRKNIVLNEQNQTIRENVDQLSALFHDFMDVLFIIDNEGNLVSANTKGCALLNLEQKEIEGFPFFDHIRPADRENLQQIFTAEQAAENSFPVNIIASGTRADVVMECRVSVNMTPGFHILVMREKEGKIVRSEILSLETEQFAGAGYWTHEIGSDSVYLSAGMSFLAGKESATMNVPVQTFLDIIHPDDREFIKRSMISVHQSPHEFVFRIIRPGGEERILRGRAYSNQNNHSGCINGVVQDITERNGMERKLQEQENSALKYLDAITEFLFIIHPDGTIIDVNTAVQKFTGREKKDLRQMLLWECPYLVMTEESQIELIDAFSAGLKGELHTVQIELKRNGAEQHSIEFILVPQFDENKRVTSFIVEGRDVTMPVAKIDSLTTDGMKLRSALALHDEIFWDWNISKDEISLYELEGQSADLLPIPNVYRMREWLKGMYTESADTIVFELDALKEGRKHIFSTSYSSPLDTPFRQWFEMTGRITPSEWKTTSAHVYGRIRNITLQKNIEEKQKTEYARLQHSVNLLEGIQIVLDAAGGITGMYGDMKAFGWDGKLFGPEPESGKLSHFSAFIEPYALKFDLPVDAILYGIEEVLEGMQPEFSLDLSSSKEGKNHYYQLSATAFPADTGGAILHMSDRTELTEQLLAVKHRAQEAEERSQFLFENTDTASVLQKIGSDEEGQPILRINKAGCGLYGFTREELMAMNLFDLDDMRDTAGYKEFLRQIDEQKTARYDTIHHTKDGRNILIEIHGLKSIEEGKPAILSLIRDITHQS